MYNSSAQYVICNEYIHCIEYIVYCNKIELNFIAQLLCFNHSALCLLYYRCLQAKNDDGAES